MKNEAYSIVVVATDSHKSWEINTEFKSGMKLKGALNDVEDIADALDDASDSHSRTTKGNQDWQITVTQIKGMIIIEKRSSQHTEAAELAPPVAKQLAADLREEHRKAWAILKP